MTLKSIDGLAALLVFFAAACSSSDNSTNNGGGCASSLCGCWEDATLSYQTKVVDQATGNPLEGIQVRCAGEDEVQATSNASGDLAFDLDTRVSPGCHYERCTNLKFVDPAGKYQDASATVFQDADVKMTPL